MKTRRSSEAKSSPSKPTVTPFMPRSQRANFDDSSEEEAADGGVQRGDESDDDDQDLPPLASIVALPTSSQSVSTRLRRTILADDEDEDEDEDENDVPIAPSSARQRKRPVINLDKNESEEEDEDDVPIAPSSSRRGKSRIINLDCDSDSDSDSDASPAKRRRTSHQAPKTSEKHSSAEPTASRKLIRKGQGSSPTKRVRGHRTQKQKNMELLRRRRAGEKIDQLTSSESESEHVKKGLYDTDSDDELQILEEFPDDEDEEGPAPAKPAPQLRKKTSPKKASKVDEDYGDDESDLDDFVVVRSL